MFMHGVVVWTLDLLSFEVVLAKLNLNNKKHGRANVLLAHMELGLKRDSVKFLADASTKVHAA
jgi:hypothetical protein